MNDVLAGRRIDHVVVLGANGAMGYGSGALFTSAVPRVTFLARGRDKADAGLKIAVNSVRSSTVANGVDTGDYELDFDRAVASADLIFEALTEDFDVKRRMFERVDKVRKPDSIVATVTSGLSINALGRGRSESFRKHFLGLHYDVSCVVGIEQMKTVAASEGGDYLGTAAWYEHEAKGVEFPFPKLFGKLGDEYDKRYGLKDEHLAAISALNYANAKLNPLAQTRTWYMNKAHACSRDDFNAAVGGRVRISDCSQVTDGSAAVVLASRAFAEKYAASRGIKLESIPQIKGWGHHTSRLKFADKVAESQDAEYVLAHVRSTITDAWRRAGLGSVGDVDGIETHDCFTTSEYMAIDHFGITKPGESWKAVEDGSLEIRGKHPINPSGGLIGAGHPVGATGVRQLLDGYKQVTGTAGDYQVEGAKTFQTLNIGGSGTTSVSFVVG